MSISSGRLRHRIIIQSQSTTKDTHGQAVTTWTDVATVWAAVEPIRGREFFAAAQINSEVTTRIRIRWRSGVTAAMRVSFDSRIYDIQAVIVPTEVHDEMQLMCKAGVTNG